MVLPFGWISFFVVVLRQKMVTNLNYTGETSPLTRSVADFATGVELQTKNLPAERNRRPQKKRGRLPVLPPGGLPPGPDAPILRSDRRSVAVRERRTVVALAGSGSAGERRVLERPNHEA